MLRRTSQTVKLRNENSTSCRSFESLSRKSGSCYLHVSEIYNEMSSFCPSDDAIIPTLFDQIIIGHGLKSVKFDVILIPTSDAEAYPKTVQSKNNNKRLRINFSCSTVNATVESSSTLSEPNNKIMLKSISVAVYLLVHFTTINKTDKDKNESATAMYHSVFVDNYHNHDHADIKSIYSFLKAIFYYTRLSSECIIVALIYLERAISYSGSQIGSRTWRKLLLGAIILASKVWDDQAVWNVDFCLVVKDLTVEEMNELERQYLILLNFNINVRTSVYAKYYFDLRSLAMSAIAKKLFVSTSTNHVNKEIQKKIKQNHEFRYGDGKNSLLNQVEGRQNGRRGNHKLMRKRNKSISLNHIKMSRFCTDERLRQANNRLTVQTGRNQDVFDRFDRLILY